MSSIDIFPWNDNFNTGVAKIDEQHQRLVDLLNQLANHIAFQSDLPALNNIFDQLADYASFHFKTEEDIWHQNIPKDPLELDHKKTHDSFVKQVLELKSNINAKPSDDVITDVLSFLTNWLALHILESDRHMAMIVSAVQSGQSIEAAKKSADQQMQGSTRTLIDVILSIYQSLSTNSLQLMRKISEQKRLENSLIDSEEKLLLFIKHAPVSLAMFDLNMNYVAVSQRWLSDFNLDTQNILGRSHYELFPNVAEERKKIHRRGFNGEVITHECDYIRLKDGSTLWIKWEVRPWRSHDGKIGGIVIFTEDITASKNAEAALKETAGVLLRAQKIGNIGNWSYQIKNAAGDIDCSDQVYNIFGLDRTTDTLTFNSVSSWLHPDDQPALDAFRQTLHSLSAESLGDIIRPIFRLKRPDGETRWIEISAECEFNDDNKPSTCFGTIQDITERKQNEKTLSKLTLAVEQTPTAIFITDIDANIEYANKAFTDVTGYQLCEVMGKNPRILQSGKNPPSIYGDMWSHLSEGKEWRGELINRDKYGNEYVDMSLISPIRDETGKVTNYLAIKENITEKKQADERIKQLAYFDQLTGLPNRGQLNERFDYTLSLAARSGAPFSLMFLDLDHFKNINDTLGHTIGDKILMGAAKRLKTVLREGDTLSRTGGDEFILLLPNTNEDGARDVAEKLITTMSNPCLVDQHELVSTVSIGIVMYPEDGLDFETLAKNADAAMYRVKKESRNDFRFFTEEMQKNSARSLLLSNALRFALARNELSLHYQPQLSIEENRITGAEALLRWNHPELGSIPPNEFIHIAEASGQILEIGEWVIRTAVNQLKYWIDNGLPPLVIAVNLSPVQFRHPNLPKLIAQILDEAQLPPEFLEIELTEAATMHDPNLAIEIMNNLNNLGIRMSIDDFGTGYSNLSYLKRFKAYKLKIDKSFVQDITIDADDRAIVLAVINLARSLGMQTIAEGVETSGQLAYLRMQGCNEIQGYYFSKPLTADEFEAYALEFGK